MGTRASYVVTYIYATASFGLKLRIEKVGGNRKRTAVSCHRHLSFSKEKKMRLRGGEVMVHRLEIRSKISKNITLFFCTCLTIDRKLKETKFVISIFLTFEVTACKFASELLVQFGE